MAGLGEPGQQLYFLVFGIFLVLFFDLRVVIVFSHVSIIDLKEMLTKVSNLEYF